MATRASKLEKRGPAKSVSKATQLKPIVANKQNGHPAILTTDEIRWRAYLEWEAAGKPPGDGIGFWLEAERQLLRKKSPENC